MDTIRIGIVGAGANTKEKHIPGFQALDGVEIVSVANRSRESGQRVADEYGISTVYDDPYDLIAADDSDAICIGTWPYMHKPLVLAALEANKHVLTEARLALNAQQAHEMLYASRLRPNLITQVVPGPITYDVDQTIIDTINEGTLGELLSVDIAVSAFDPSKGMQGTFINPDLPFLWRHDRDLNGMNVMLMGVWYEAIMRWLGPASSITALDAHEREGPSGLQFGNAPHGGAARPRGDSSGDVRGADSAPSSQRGHGSGAEPDVDVRERRDLARRF